LVDRADAVLPAVPGHEVAAGVAHCGDAELADQRGDVAPQAVCVGGGVVRFVDAGVDAPSEVLDESPEDAAPDGAEG
jgi:hypothetical protein